MKVRENTSVATTAGSSWSSVIAQRILDFKLLVKFRLTMTVVFSAVMAFAIVSGEQFSWVAMLVLASGGFFVTAASNALNQVLEKDYDRLMKRTADRPIAAGRMSISEGVLAAGLMSLVGIMLLALFNPWSAFFGTLAMVSYAFVYTPLKRVSTLAIPVGAVPGALPMLIGAVAFEGELSMLALTLFSIQFLWQFPHFWSIGWVGFDEYQKAGYRFLPSVNGERDPRIGIWAAIYALLLIPLGFVPMYLGVGGWISAMTTALLSLGYAWMGWKLYKEQNRQAAMKLMFFSFIYLPMVLVVMFLDNLFF